MIPPFLGLLFLVSSPYGAGAIPSPSPNSFNLKPFTINLSHEVPHMMDLVERTRLPTNAEYLDPKAGIALETLVSLKNELVHNFDWENEQKELNKYAPVSNIGSQLVILMPSCIGSTITLPKLKI
jgi:hypothetical protein